MTNECLGKMFFIINTVLISQSEKSILFFKQEVPQE